MMLDHRLLTLTVGIRFYLTGLILVGLLIAVTYLGQGLLVARGVFQIFAGAAWAEIVPLLGGILLLIMLRIGLLWLREVSAIRTAAAVKQSLRRRLYAHLLDLGPGYLLQQRTGAVQSTLVDGVEALEGYMGYYIPQAFVALITPLLVLAYLFFLDPLIGVMVLASVVLAVYGPRLWDRLLGEYGESHWRAYAALNAQFVDTMQGMTTLKAFNAGIPRGHELQARADELYRATMRQLSVSLIRTGVVGLAVGTGTAFAVGVGAVRLATGALALPEVLILLFLAGECFRPLADLDKYWHQGYMGISAAGGIFALLDARPAVVDASHSLATDTTAITPAVAFRNVTFAYQRSARPALRNLSFVIEPGETVALVGPSGAGKTTVTALLLRFFDPQQGQITLGGRDLRDYRLETLRSSMAIVSQETYLFHGTIADNLRLARPAATRAELEAVAQAANIHDFIMALPQGYDTLVGERGMKLSGGERQRIAIARALLKDAPILLLDEATSSVDAANEAAIQAALDRLTAGRTTLVIAHRLSTVVNADRIVVIDAGELVEIGQHRELLARAGAYRRLVAAQQEGL